MKQKIAIYYHCRLSDAPTFTPGTDHAAHPIDPAFAAWLMNSQMRALERSGLAAAAEEIHIGVNGDKQDTALAKLIAPKNSQVVSHGNKAVSEIQTLNLLRRWLPEHSDWVVFYHHIKAISHPTHAGYQAWRQRMEDACVWRWKQCVSDLEAGYDAVGCHWLTPKEFPGTVKSPFFGGNFFWATAKFLATLPPLAPATWQNRHEAESWIGYSKQKPKIKDYYKGFPTV